MGYSWLTVHRVRFKAPRSAREEGTPPGPAGAAAWRFGPHSPRGEDGLRTGVSDVWGGIAFYDTRAAAEEVLRDPAADLSFLPETSENWHALACVVSTRGRVDWSTPTEPHPALEPLGADPKGVLAVITTAGYEVRDESQLPRIRDFLERVDAVIDFYGTLDQNVVRALFNGTEAKEGMTFSVWKSDAGMMASAYKSGTHSENLRRHTAEPMFDYSSFTRLRLLESAGTWDGIDPRAVAAAAAA